MTNHRTTDGPFDYSRAPLPWQAKAANKQYLQIVDANGNAVCDFFPFARKSGRGWDATMAIAEQIVEMMNGK